MQKKQVLTDHLRKGKRLIPPIMQLEKLVETSFRDDTLPDLLWMSAIFLRHRDREAVSRILEFTEICNDSLNRKDAPPLGYLGNFERLSTEEKKGIHSALFEANLLKKIQDDLWHHHRLFPAFPLAFLFKNVEFSDLKTLAIDRLKEDVDALLDRHSRHATKVQTTLVVSMLQSQKLFFGPDISVPDFNSIFTAPDSDGAKRVASFCRANLNAGMGLRSSEQTKSLWALQFWTHAFALDGCR